MPAKPLLNLVEITWPDFQRMQEIEALQHLKGCPAYFAIDPDGAMHFWPKPHRPLIFSVP